MKYYIYVSDTKVDMLYAQIPVRTRDKIATELKIDLKVISATFSEDPLEVTRFSKLQVVTQYIHKHEKAGTVDEPTSYFYGTIPMRWGAFSVPSEFVYFGGETNNTILGLGGSRKHVIGENGESVAQTFSTTGAIWNVLKTDWQLHNKSSNKKTQTKVDIEILDIVARSTQSMEGPIQNLEFLAKKFLDGPSLWNPRIRVILGSPIYVALAD